MNLPILCATDFSDAATRVSNAAAAIAARWDSTLILAHVCETFHAAEKTLSSSLHLAAQDLLHKEGERLRQKNVLVEEVLLEGSPHEAILELCERRPVRLIVMASRKSADLASRWLFGGTVRRLITDAKVPTLVVRDVQVFEDWLVHQKPLRVFVAVNLSSFSDIPLHWVRDFARIAPCEITVAYLNWIPDEIIRLGLFHIPLFEGSRELQVMLEHELRERSRAILGELPFKIRVEPRQDRADLPLIGMARHESAGLFVVGRRLRNVFSRIFDESVSVDVLHNAPMGVVVVPLVETAVQAPLPVIDRVLVPTDFSDPANLAIRYACSILSSGGTISLVHITHRFGLSEQEAMDQLSALIPQEATERGLDFETLVWSDPVPATAIANLAARLRADVICLGTQGKSGIAKALLGSTVQTLLANSLIPVLIVRKPA